MGGYGSTRWTWEHTRIHTDPLLSLDVRYLKRIGALESGAIAQPSWTCRGKPSGTIITVMNRKGDCLTLKYQTRGPGETDWTPHTQPVWLDTTPCHYGGERVWFTCPGCQCRRAVLFSVGGLFRCRGCHDLAYSSTRESALDRSYRRIDRIQRQLGSGGYGVPVWHLPPKPARMHWSTYERLVRELRLALHEHDGLFDQWIAERWAMVDRLEQTG